MSTVRIRIENAGLDVGPFNIFSNIDGYKVAFEFQRTRDEMLNGITTTLPVGTARIRVVSSNQNCRDVVEIDI